MSIRLREARQIAGSVVGAGTLVSLSDAAEADLVHARLADPVSRRWLAATCVVLGDSITENNTYPSTNSIAHGQRGYMTWANMLLGQKRLHLLNNAGVSGQTSLQIRGRVRSDVLAYSPTWCVVMAGTNDLYGQLSPLPGVLQNLDGIYNDLLAAGIKVAACAVPPVGSTHAGWSHQAHARVRELNRWIAARCAQSPESMVFVDCYGAVIDPTDASANPRSGYFWDTPAVHPSAQGAYAIGLAIKNALSARLPDFSDLHASVVDDWSASVQTVTTLTGANGVLQAVLSNHKLRTGDVVTVSGANESGFNGRRQVIGYDAANFYLRGSGVGTATGTIVVSNSSNLFDEGLFQGSGGTAGTGVTGTVATGWTVERDAGTPTAVCSVSARADGFGNDQVIAITSGANADAIRLRSASLPTRVFSGQTIYAEMAFDASAITALNLLNLRLNVLVGSNLWRYDGGHSDFTDAFPTAGCSGVYRTPPITVPDGAVTQLRTDSVARFNGVGGATVKYGRARLVVVNDFPDTP